MDQVLPNTCANSGWINDRRTAFTPWNPKLDFMPIPSVTVMQGHAMGSRWCVVLWCSYREIHSLALPLCSSPAHLLPTTVPFPPSSSLSILPLSPHHHCPSPPHLSISSPSLSIPFPPPSPSPSIPRGFPAFLPLHFLPASLFAQKCWCSAQLELAHLGMAQLGLTHFGQAILSQAVATLDQLQSVWAATILHIIADLENTLNGLKHI